MAMVDPGTVDVNNADMPPPYLPTVPHGAAKEAACQTEAEPLGPGSDGILPSTVATAEDGNDGDQSDYGDFEEGRDTAGEGGETERDTLLGPNQREEDPGESTLGVGPYGLLAGLLITVSNPHKN